VGYTNLTCQKLELNYPCVWKYKLIIKSDANIQTIIKQTISNRKHKGLTTNKSSKGKFVSYLVETQVQDEEDRLNLHRIFSNHKDIKMII